MLYFISQYLPSSKSHHFLLSLNVETARKMKIHVLCHQNSVNLKSPRALRLRANGLSFGSKFVFFMGKLMVDTSAPGSTYYKEYNRIRFAVKTTLRYYLSLDRMCAYCSRDSTQLGYLFELRVN